MLVSAVAPPTAIIAAVIAVKRFLVMLLVPFMYRQVCLPDSIPKNLLLVGETQDADNLRPVTYCANVLDRIYRINRIFGGSSRVERVDRVDWGEIG